MSLDHINPKFLSYCRTKGLSDHTLRAYRQDLADFSSWAARAKPHDLYTKDTVLAWMADMQARKLAPATAKRRIACLKVLFRWLEDEEQIADSPFHRLRATVRLPKRLPRNLTQDEITKLLNSRQTSPSFKSETLSLALELLLTTGVRIGELCAVRLAELDLGSGVITIKGKGNRERRVFLVDEAIKQQITAYLTRRRTRTNHVDALLITPRGAPATADYIRKNLHKRVEGLRINRKITPHMLRHTAATQLLENGLDIRYVQKLLGHASISTTEIYTHVSDKKLQAAIKAASPRR